MHDVMADRGQAAVDVALLTALGAEIPRENGLAVGADDRAGGGMAVRLTRLGLDRAAQQAAFDRCS